MKFITFARRLMLMLVVATLAACGTTGSFVTETMSNKDYLAKSPTERADYLKSVKEEAAAIEAKNEVERMAGRPVYVGDDKTGKTIQWDKVSRLLYVYPGHNPKGMGLETYGAVALATNEHGHVKYDLNTGRPMTVFVNVAVQEDLLRATLKTVAGAVPSAFNGAVAAKINTDACKGRGCGGTEIQLTQQTYAAGGHGVGGGASASSGSVAASQSGAQAGVNTCSTCGLAPQPAPVKPK